MRTVQRFRRLSSITAITAAVAGSAVIAIAPNASAASTSTLVAAARGWVQDDGESAGLAVMNNYLAGHVGAVHRRDAFVFDLSTVHATVTAAQLVLDNGKACANFTSLGAASTFQVFAVNTATNVLEHAYAGGDSTGQSVYADLGSGIVYGATTLSDENQSPVAVDLNTQAIGFINVARGGNFAVGGSYSEGAVTDHYIFGGTGTATCGVSLKLTVDPSTQTITFPNPGPLTYGVAPVALTATASSGLPVSYAVISGPCSVSGATLTVLGAGSCDVRASQAGDDDWAPAHVDDTIVINKAPTTTTMTAMPSAPHLGQPVTYLGTVRPIAPFFGATGPSGSVVFSVDGGSAATVQLTGPTASFTTAFGGGAHIVSAIYTGDHNFLPSDAATTTTVACDRTLTGTVSATTVTSGLTCIDHASVKGGISVAKGAALDLENSTVHGSISANAPAGIRICGSTTGAMSVSGATGVVVIGDPRGINHCAANGISSGITVANNKAPVVVVGNTVPRVTAANNTGGQTITGNHP